MSHCTTGLICGDTRESEEWRQTSYKDTKGCFHSAPSISLSWGKVSLSVYSLTIALNEKWGPAEGKKIGNWSHSAHCHPLFLHILSNFSEISNTITTLHCLWVINVDPSKILSLESEWMVTDVILQSSFILLHLWALLKCSSWRYKDWILQFY